MNAVSHIILNDLLPCFNCPKGNLEHVSNKTILLSPLKHIEDAVPLSIKTMIAFKQASGLKAKNTKIKHHL